MSRRVRTRGSAQPGFAVMARSRIALTSIALASIALATLATACQPRQALIGLFLYDRNDPYINEFARQILDLSQGRFLAVEHDAGNSQLSQNAQLEAMIKRRPALVMVNPVDRLASYAIVRRLSAEGIPVIFFNREPLERDLRLWDEVYYVGARAEQSGRMQAELAMELFGGTPSALNAYDRNGDGVIQLVLLKGEQGHQDAELRTKAFFAAFEEAGFSVETLAIEVANWKRDEAFEKIGAVARELGGRIELVASNNDAMALGAIDRLKELGYFGSPKGDGPPGTDGRGWLPVLGIDGLAEAEESIAQGLLYATVKNDSLSMARAMVELADRLIEGEPLDGMSFPARDGVYLWIDYQPFVR